MKDREGERILDMHLAISLVHEVSQFHLIFRITYYGIIR